MATPSPKRSKWLRAWIVSLVGPPGLFVVSIQRLPMAMAGEGPPNPSGDVLLGEIFQDHAVLQRDRPIALWGRAGAGETVQLSLESPNAGPPVAEVTTQADSAGNWRTRLPEVRAGGPFLLKAHGSSGTSQTVRDVLAGDVFLCSGQSNMEMPVLRASDSYGEIQKSSNNTIRYLGVAHAVSPTPLAEFQNPVAWQIASPDTVSEWSAVCFFFGRELQSATHTPIGLIHASWGGANIRPFMSTAALHSIGSYETGLRILETSAKDSAAAQAEFAREWESWWRAKSGDAVGAEPWHTQKTPSRPGATDFGWKRAPAGLGDWRTYGDPELSSFTGLLWYRTRITLTAAQAKTATSLSLGPINQVDETWINGRAIGNTFGYETERTYTLPPGVLHAGENSLVINVVSTYGPGGLLSRGVVPSIKLSDGQPVLLSKWEYRKVSSAFGYPPRAPWEPVGGLSTLYNAMIAPIGPYTLRGALWYQGESNTGEAESYQSLLTGMMADWRHQFWADLPFLIVQLPNFGVPPSQPQESGWAQVREAERRAVANDPHAGLAVTIDIGDAHNLHPTNKQDVARRLARAARHVIFGEALSPSGPTPVSAVRGDGQIVVEFGGIEQKLVAFSHATPIGFELCGAAPATCQYAEARIEGTHILLTDAPGVSKVRYCWADSPVCTLFDRSGLPAVPFEADIEDGPQHPADFRR